jgi:hypothetical protein
MRILLIVVAATLTCAGCAGMSAEQCRDANWYDLGFRDAIFGIQRQDDVYAGQCAPHAVSPDVARYAQGWREGTYEFEARKPHGVD